VELTEARELIKEMELKEELTNSNLLEDFIYACLMVPTVSILDANFDIDEIYFDTNELGGSEFTLKGKCFEGNINDLFFQKFKEIIRYEDPDPILLSFKGKHFQFNLYPDIVSQVTLSGILGGGVMGGMIDENDLMNDYNYLTKLHPVSKIIKEYAQGFSAPFVNWPVRNPMEVKE